MGGEALPTDPTRRRRLTFLVFGLALATISATRIATTYKALDFGASSFQVGLVAGAFGALAVIFSIAIGRGIDLWGERWFFVAGITLILVAPFVALRSQGLIGLVVSQSLLGLGQAGLAISMQTSAAHSSSSLEVDQQFASIAVMQSFSQFVGPTVAGITIERGRASGEPVAGADLTYLVAAAVSAICAVAAVFVVRSSALRRQSTKRVPIGTILRANGVVGALVASISVLVSIDVLVAYLPVIGEERGISPSVVGILLSVRAGAGMVARLSVTPLLARLGRHQLLSLTLLVMAFAMVALPFLSQTLALALAVGLLGFCINLGAPLTASWVAGSVAPEARGSALATRMTANRLAQILIPAALGLVAVGAGTWALFVVAGVGLIGSSEGVRRTAPATGES